MAEPSGPAYIWRMLRDHREFLRQFRTQFQTTVRHCSEQPAAGPGDDPPHRLPSRTGPHPGGRAGHRRRDAADRDSAQGGRLSRHGRAQPGLRPAARAAVSKRADLQAGRRSGAVHVCGIESFQSERPYDYIVSGLPFNNFSPAFVGRVLDAFFNFLAPGACCRSSSTCMCGRCAA